MLQNVDAFYSHAQPYIALLNGFAKKHSLVGTAHADHICYKCGSVESFEHIRALFETASSYLHQSIISQRRIAYIKFKRPIETDLGPIYFLELSDQKPDLSQKEGFDHIEVYSTAQSYEDFVKGFEATEKVTKVERPHHTTDDIEIRDGFLFRCTQGPLIEKIKNSQMD